MTAASAGYSREAVLRMAKVSSRQVTAWENKQLIQRRQSYDFDDLRTIKALNRLRKLLHDCVTNQLAHPHGGAA